MINTVTRNNCRPCRFNKCLNVGMKKHLVETEAVTSDAKACLDFDSKRAYALQSIMPTNVVYPAEIYDSNCTDTKCKKDSDSAVLVTYSPSERRVDPKSKIYSSLLDPSEEHSMVTKSTEREDCNSVELAQGLEAELAFARLTACVPDQSESYQEIVNYESMPLRVHRNTSNSIKRYQQSESSDHVNVYCKWLPQRNRRKTRHPNTKSLGSQVLNEKFLQIFQPEQISYLTKVISNKSGILWIKLNRSAVKPPFLSKFCVGDTLFEPWKIYKIVLEMSYEAENSLSTNVDEYFVTTEFPDLLNLLTPDLLTLCLETRDCEIIFQRDPHPIFNVTVSSSANDYTSIVIMESLTEEHWLRIQEIVSVSRILCRFLMVNHETYGTGNKRSCLLFAKVGNACKIISRAIESLSFFRELCIEDQFIVLKESFCLVDCLHVAHTYDEELDSFVFSALDRNLSFCIRREGLQTYLTHDFAMELDEFNNSFVEKFYGFLRKDYFVICILSLLCIVQDKPGLTCSDLFDQERKIYCEIFDAYIKAKILSSEWTLDPDDIWTHVHSIFSDLSRYMSIFKQYQRESERMNRYSTNQ